MHDSIDANPDAQTGDCWVGDDDYDRWLAELSACLPAYDGYDAPYRDLPRPARTPEPTPARTGHYGREKTMTQDQVNEMAANSGTTIRLLRESGATAVQLRCAANWLREQPGYHGKLARSTSKADRMLGPGYPYERNTPVREAANMCAIAAGEIEAEARHA